MQLTKDKVAIINYILKDSEGKIMDESKDASFTYLHGAKRPNLIPALENALEGKEAGDKVNAVIEAKDAYGPRDESRIQRVDKSVFPVDRPLEVGMAFRSTSPEVPNGTVVITAIEGDEVEVDPNHPLAGVDLHFEIELVEVRDATEEEIELGVVEKKE